MLVGVLDETVNVNVTANDPPAEICAPCPVQVKVMYVLAVEEFQLFTLKLSAMAASPVSFT
jgi:hypothetical protein